MSQYVDEFKVSLSTVNANLAHTCGNVSSIIFDNFKSNFPNNFFKYEHVNTRLAVRQFQDIKKVVDFKKQKPMLAMQPKINIENTDNNIDMWRRLYGTNMYDLLRPDYHNVKFFKDIDKGIYIDFSVDRIKMSFEFSLIVSTEYQQYNTAAHMKNTFRIEHPFYIPTTLETVIPECIIKQVVSDSGIPYHDPITGDSNIELFLEYMNKISNLPITYEFQPSTGIYRFFMVVSTNIFATYSSFSVNDGDRDGQVVDNFPITLQLDIEFNYPNCFFYLNKEKTQNYIDTDDSTEVISTQGDLQLYYTMQNTIIPQKDEVEREMYVSVALAIEDVDLTIIDAINEDTVPLISLFTQDRVELINFLNNSTENIPDDYMNIVLYKNGTIVDKTLYNVNWETLELTIVEPDSRYTYRLVCYESNTIRNNYIRRMHKY